MATVTSALTPALGSRRADGLTVFVGGLHRSGTTPLTRCLAAHPEVSGFAGTGVPEDEGQHLQDVYPTARSLGGPGRFARNSHAHLTERSPLAVQRSAERLWRSWSQHWDLDRRVLVEKSPPNLLMTRFLHRLFPEAAFLLIMRHPVVVTLSTAKWAPRTPLPRLMDNWFAAHDIVREDLRHLPRALLISYEELVQQPEHTLAGVRELLSLASPIPHGILRSDRSTAYRDRWEAMGRSSNPLTRSTHAYILARYGRRAETYGYSLVDLERADTPAFS